MVKAKGIPDGKNLLAHSQSARLAQHHWPQRLFGRADVEHRQIFGAVRAHQDPVVGLV